MKAWPEDRQAHDAYRLLGLEQEDWPGDDLSEEEQALDEAEVAGGEVASDKDIESALQRLRQAR